HLESVPSRIVVIGGASTGCQLASIFRDFGAEVTLLEAAGRLVAKEDVDVGETLARAFAARGIDVRTSARTERVERMGTSVRAIVSRPSGREQVMADAVFLAVGWPGNTEELALDAAGIETDRDYIRVDQQLRTSQPHVFAIGDVTGIKKLVQ